MIGHRVSTLAALALTVGAIGCVAAPGPIWRATPCARMPVADAEAVEAAKRKRSRKAAKRLAER